MPVETQLELLFEVIEGGRAIAPAEIVQFPVDAGATALEGITETVELGNGVATEVSQLTAIDGGASTTAGIGILGVEVGAVGAAIAPALGILAGVGLYNLAPEFWNGVANKLIEAGETVNGKVRAFLNANDRTVGFTEETIEIFKNALIEAGIYNGDAIIEDGAVPTDLPDLARILNSLYPLGITNYSFRNYVNADGGYYEYKYNSIIRMLLIHTVIGDNPTYYIIFASAVNGINQVVQPGGGQEYTISLNKSFTYDENTVYYNYALGLYSRQWANITEGIVNNFTNEIMTIGGVLENLAYMIVYGTYKNTAPLQDNAVFPEIAEPIPATYPDWSTRSYELPDEQTKIYPLTMPVIDPAPLQAPAQNPLPLPDNDPALLDWLIDAMQLPQPNPSVEPSPVPALDPDPQPTPEPIAEPTKPNTDSDPINPNPEPTTPFLPIVPTLPDSVPANAMFTVYKPTISQVNDFGGWLWSNSILETIKRIWQNPLDGIIAFMKVYVDAPTSGNDTIKVGVLDSEVSSAVVSGQFVTVECGSIDIEEKFFNATDYSPFVALHLYLPFIGIVELDIDEFMGGSIKVTYHVDVYTGTCLAEVKAKRNHDMDNYTIVYTFSGNASQQLPLTSAEFGGALSALVGVVGGGLAIASGGGLGLLAGASGIAHAVTHEMVHLAHSGSLSANAGIMGARTPYLILTRRRGYDANGYNQIYGYPANKTVYLNNCSGLVRVKDIQLKTGATDLEANEIVSLLKDGVIV